jgi:hypothetical protein
MANLPATRRGDKKGPGFRPAVALFAALFVLHGTAGDAKAQEFTLSGYLLELPAVQWIPDGAARAMSVESVNALNAARLRVRSSLSLWEGASLSAEYELSAALARKAAVFGLSAELGHRQIAPLRWKISSGSNHIIEHFIDRLSFRQNLDAGSVIVGRQRISWGTGRIWNPTDLFNPVNPANYGKIEKDGVDAVSARLAFGSFTDLQGVVNATRDFESVNAAARFRTNFSGYDYSMMAGRFDGSVVIGGDLAGSISGAGIRAEVLHAFERSADASPHTKMILGADYQFTPELYALLEYHFNGEGAPGPDGYDLERLASGRVLNLGRSYVAAMANYLLHPLVAVSASGTASITDGSVLFHVMTTWSALDDLQVSLGGMLSAGDSGDEYPYYPRVLYARAEWQF